MEEREPITSSARELPAGERGGQLVSVETQTEYDLLSGDWQQRTFVKLYVEARISGLLAAISDRNWKTLCTLATYMDSDGYCFPSQAELARALGCSRQMANARVKSLESFKFHSKSVLVVVKGEHGPDGRWTRNGYRILPLSRLRIFDHKPRGEAVHGQRAERGRAVSKKVDTATSRTVSIPTVTAPVDTNETHPQQDSTFRNSKVGSVYLRGSAKPITAGVGAQHRTDPYSGIAARTSSRLRRSLVTPMAIGDVLRQRYSGSDLKRSAGDKRSLDQVVERPSAQLAACIAEITQDLEDRKHLRSNVTQAYRLLERGRMPEVAFISVLYEARAVTQDRRSARGTTGGSRPIHKPMAYFWRVVRDLVGEPVDGMEPEASPDNAEDPTSGHRPTE